MNDESSEARKRTDFAISSGVPIQSLNPVALDNVATGSYIIRMIRAGIRDLKNNLSRYIKRLGVEKRIVVTDRGEAVAELRLPETKASDPHAQRYAQLVAAGVVRPAIDAGDPLADWPSAGELSLPAGTAKALIDEDRDDR
jgi:antitoxin (DNA-binding transcriptional repressor) of toxin-antitoxin stability system